jgi:hypothetical protein
MVTRALALTLAPSLPGLTRQSIVLCKKFLHKEMDARVKPAHDDAMATAGPSYGRTRMPPVSGRGAPVVVGKVSGKPLSVRTAR